jgi:hypothetical protein
LIPQSGLNRGLRQKWLIYAAAKGNIVLYDFAGVLIDVFQKHDSLVRGMFLSLFM